MFQALQIIYIEVIHAVLQANVQGSVQANSQERPVSSKLTAMTENPTTNSSQKKNDTLEGTVPDLVDPAQRDAAMDLAFDYRGDVTIETKDGQTIEGYIFDRRVEHGKPVVRVMPTKNDDRLTIPYENITRLTFSGRDTAAGKSWETWVRKYAEKKAAGQKAEIKSDPLD